MIRLIAITIALAAVACAPELECTAKVEAGFGEAFDTSDPDYDLTGDGIVAGDDFYAWLDACEGVYP